MRIYDETKDICVKNTAVTLGKFDALHLGHQNLIKAINEQKRANNYETVLFSFDTMGMRHQQVLTTKKERIEICREFDIDNLIFYPVNENTMAMEPEQFISEILVNDLDAKIIVTGKDFCFGRNRCGNIEMLESYSKKYNFELIVSDDIMVNNEKVSSSNIKEHLRNGRIEEAGEMLGYDYFIMGQVTEGKQNGRKIDTRTINIIPEDNKLLPPKGVYKTCTNIGNRRFKSITNIGVNPTVKSDNKIVVETHILDFNGNLKKSEVKIDFLKFIREERKFSDLEALKRQILLDISEANL